MNSELDEKLALIRAHCEAVEVAKENLERTPNHRNAQLLQRAKRFRDELRATLPKPRLVA